MRNPDSWRQLYPFKSHVTAISGYRLHYLDEGTGETFLMVHGNPTWSFYWRNLVTAWRDRYRIVAPDHIGCGLSDRPQRYDYCLERHADNLLELINHLQLQNITLFAHDWGGAIGLKAAITEPELFSRFVLLNTGGFPPSRVPRRIAFCRTPVIGTWAIRGMNVFPQAALHMAVTQRQRMTSAVRAGILAPYDNWGNRVGIQRFIQDIPLSKRHRTYRVLEDLESKLSRINKFPVQFIWGMRDWCFTPQCLDRFLQSIPSAEVHRLDEAGHWVVEDAHEKIVPLVDAFLSKHPIQADQTASVTETIYHD